MLKIKSNLIFIIKKINYIYMRRTPSPRLRTRKKTLLLPSLSLIGKNFSSLIFYCITSREVSFWCPKINKKILRKYTKKKRRNKVLVCGRLGHPTLGCPNPLFFLWQGRREDASFSRKEERRGAHIGWGVEVFSW